MPVAPTAWDLAVNDDRRKANHQATASFRSTAVRIILAACCLLKSGPDCIEIGTRLRGVPLRPSTNPAIRAAPAIESVCVIGGAGVIRVVMELTCPECKHIVEVDPTEPTKCANCGAMVSAPGPPPSPPAVETTSPPAEPPSAASQPSGSTSAAEDRLQAQARIPTAVDQPATPTTRAAANVAFVLALLFFLPFIPQLIAIGVGLYAVARKRLPNERVTLAWLAIVLSALVFPCWLLLISTVTSLVSTARTRIFTAPPYAQAPLDESWMVTSDLSEQMERVFNAASSYRRDFGKWPSSVDILVGKNLPRGFRLSPRLTYRPVPPSETRSFTWVLLVSDEVHYDLSGEQFETAHRLVLRLNGRVEVLPNAQVQTLLAEQRPAESILEPDQP